MTRKFKVGDIVKLEGKLVDNNDPNSAYTLKLELGAHARLIFTPEGEYYPTSTKILELVEAAPVEIEIGKPYVVGGSTRVPLEIFDGRVFYRLKEPQDVQWWAFDCSIELFQRRYIND